MYVVLRHPVEYYIQYRGAIKPRPVLTLPGGFKIDQPVLELSGRILCDPDQILEAVLVN